jgi:hypothetical protein
MEQMKLDCKIWSPVLNKYRINQIIGEGAFGTVVSATNKSTA